MTKNLHPLQHQRSQKIKKIPKLLLVNRSVRPMSNPYLKIKKKKSWKRRVRVMITRGLPQPVTRGTMRIQLLHRRRLKKVKMKMMSQKMITMVRKCMSQHIKSIIWLISTI